MQHILIIITITVTVDWYIQGYVHQHYKVTLEKNVSDHSTRTKVELHLNEIEIVYISPYCSTFCSWVPYVIIFQEAMVNPRVNRVHFIFLAGR